MVKRLSDTEIWKKDWFLDLTDKQKLLVKFLYDNCDCAGIYEISKRMLRICFYEDITKEDFEGIKQVRFINENTIFIEDFIKFQYKTEIPLLNTANGVHRGIIRRLEKYNLLTPTVPLTKSTGIGIGIGIGIGNNTFNNKETPNQPLTNPCAGVSSKDEDFLIVDDIPPTPHRSTDPKGGDDPRKEKEKEIRISNNISSLVLSSLNEKKEKNDPYVNPIKSFFIEEYKKVFGKKPFLGNTECNRLLELSAENPDIREHIPTALERLKKIDFEDINFTPSASWLLKANNFERVMNGEFEPKQKRNIFEELEREAREAGKI